jgi:hypothetical protein
VDVLEALLDRKVGRSEDNSDSEEVLDFCKKASLSVLRWLLSIVCDGFSKASGNREDNGKGRGSRCLTETLGDEGADENK